MSKLIIGVITVVIVIGGGVFLWSKSNTSKMHMQTNTMPSQMPEQTQTSPTGSASAATGKNAVTIQNFAFSPATLTIKVGDKVTWTNQDSVGHSATADDGTFDTGVLSQGQSGSVTFSKAGTYTYHCSVHPSMKGTIVVQ